MYKVEAFVEKCLVSCESQNIESSEYEIIAVNDGSPDKSKEIAESFAKEHLNVRVISKDNGGLSSARNTGIANSKGDYIFFVDSDDWIQGNCLKRITDTLKSEKPDVLAICAADVIGEQNIRRFSYSGMSSSTGPEALTVVPNDCAPFLIVNREFLNKYGLRFYEGIYHEDSEYTPRMLYYAEKVSYLDDIIYYVYQNPNSITRSYNPKKVYDVISIVTPHLFQYARDVVKKEYQYIYYDKICGSISTVIIKNLKMDEEARLKTDQLFYENRFLIEAYKNSSLRKYRMLSMLLAVFPKHVFELYKLFNVIRKNK